MMHPDEYPPEWRNGPDREARVIPEIAALKDKVATAPYDPQDVENDGYGDAEPAFRYCQKCGVREEHHVASGDGSGPWHTFVANDPPPAEPVDWEARCKEAAAVLRRFADATGWGRADHTAILAILEGRDVAHSGHDPRIDQNEEHGA